MKRLVVISLLALLVLVPAAQAKHVKHAAAPNRGISITAGPFGGYMLTATGLNSGSYEAAATFCNDNSGTPGSCENIGWSAKPADENGEIHFILSTPFMTPSQHGTLTWWIYEDNGGYWSFTPLTQGGFTYRASATL